MTEIWRTGPAPSSRAAGRQPARDPAADALPANRQRSVRRVLQEGEKRTVIRARVHEIGPSLRYATAKPTTVSRGGAAGDTGDTGDDSWSTPGGWSDEPPF